jgi:hypothetical protein
MIAGKLERTKLGGGASGPGDFENTPIPTGLPERPELRAAVPAPSFVQKVAMTDTRRPNNDRPQAPVSIARNDALADFSVMIRVGPNGTIVKNKGGTEELAGVVAYTQRLIELVGDLLGLDRFVAMECTFKENPGQTPGGATRCLLFSEANGDTVALRPRTESNIQALRESLGL